MKVKRIQRKRTRGWRMPPNTVSVSRPGKWGNPFRVAGYTNESHLPPEILQRFAVDDFESALADNRLGFTVDDIRRELQGKNLACWCKEGSPCHADVLIAIANGNRCGTGTPD